MIQFVLFTCLRKELTTHVVLCANLSNEWPTRVVLCAYLIKWRNDDTCWFMCIVHIFVKSSRHVFFLRTLVKSGRHVLIYKQRQTKDSQIWDCKMKNQHQCKKQSVFIESVIKNQKTIKDTEHLKMVLLFSFYLF